MKDMIPTVNSTEMVLRALQQTAACVRRPTWCLTGDAIFRIRRIYMRQQISTQQ